MSESEIPRREFLKKATIPIAVLAGISGGMLGGGIGANPSGGISIDEKVKITSSDTTTNFLNLKIAVASALSKTILNPNANEQLQLDVSPNTFFPNYEKKRFIQVNGVQHSAVALGAIVELLGGTQDSDINATNGTFTKFDTPATKAGLGGWRTTLHVGTSRVTWRQFNPKVRIRFRMIDIGADLRFFILITDQVLSNDDTQSSKNMAGIRVSTIAGDVQFMYFTRNSSAGPTVNFSGQSKDTNPHILSIELQNNPAQVKYQIDSLTPVIVTTNVPNASTNLGLLCSMITQASIVKSWSFAWATMEWDK